MGETYGGPRSPLKLRLDMPWQARPAVLMQHFVCANGVFVLGIDQKTVHVEEACLDGREADLYISCELEPTRLVYNIL